MGSRHSGSTSSNIEVWPVRLELCELGCTTSPIEVHKKRTLPQTRRIGRPPQPILEDGRQLPWLVSNGRTKSANTYEKRRSTAQRCILLHLVDQKIGWFKKETVENIQEWTFSFHEIIVIADNLSREKRQRMEETSVSSWTILIEFGVNVSCRSWGRCNNSGWELSAYSVRIYQFGPSAWCRSFLRPRIPVHATLTRSSYR